MCSPLVLSDVKSDLHERFPKTTCMSRFKAVRWVSQPKRSMEGAGGVGCPHFGMSPHELNM